MTTSLLYNSEPNISPVMYTYVIYKRDHCCYKYMCLIRIHHNKYYIKINNIDSEITISLTIPIHEIVDILSTRGFPANGFYLIKIYHINTLLELNKQMSLLKIFKIIIQNETLVADGYYI
jgi:hypothetical protein